MQRQESMMTTEELGKQAVETTDSAKPYRTSDMYVAAYLMYAKANFLKVEKEKDAQGRPSKRSFFYFEKTPGFEKLVAEYFNGKGMVPANDFAAKIRDVKTLTHSG